MFVGCDGVSAMSNKKDTLSPEFIVRGPEKATIVAAPAVDAVVTLIPVAPGVAS